MRRFGLFALLTLLTLVAVATLGVNYLSRSFRVVTSHNRAGGDDVAIDTPAGRFNIRSSQNIDPATLGVPIYPDARRTKDSAGASFEWSSADGTSDKAVSVAGGDYVTADSAEKVRAWYHEHLPNWIVVAGKNDEKAHFELNEGGYKRMIAIIEKSDGTNIGVATVGEPASN